MFAQRGGFKLLREMVLNFQPLGLWGGVAALVFLSHTVAAQDLKPAIAPPASWVAPIRAEGPFTFMPPDPSLDSRWLLVERQINAQNDGQFYRWVHQILTPGGADRSSRVSIAFDPNYETVTMHWVRIWRGTNVLNRLDAARFQWSQAGAVPNAFLFSSKRSVTFPLDDVRPGDIVDYAYSINGGNPAMGGMFTGRVALQFTEPVDRVVTRLLWQPPRKLYIQNHGTQIVPATLYKSNFVEFTWDSLNVPALRMQPPTPVWYNPYPWVELSEFQKWSDVNRWALGLFTTSATNNAALREISAKVAEWKGLPTPEQRAGAALDFVQQQIRYIGPENGGSDYQPPMPAVVFARRYGSGKDKVCLLVTLLRAMGIDASPMLVSSKERQLLSDLHPTPDVFDRAIVQVALDGRYYFLDPTAVWERGPLSARSWPNYAYGLPIAPGTTALRVIPRCPVLPKTTQTAYFDIGGFDQASGVKIVTVADGPDAEELRERFATTPRDEIERDFLETEAKYYPDIRPAGHLEFNDEEQSNRVEITESYTIPKFWERRPDESYYHCRFFPVNVAEAMYKPANTVRTQPLGIAYPVHRVSRVEASWLVGWPVQPDNQLIQNPAFTFSRTMNLVGTNLVIEHDYQTLSDFVAADAYPTYLRQLNAAGDYLGCNVVAY
jgi:transglutaminase-like putative cysteine protease